MRDFLNGRNAYNTSSSDISYDIFGLQDHMPPSSGTVAQTPEQKSTGGLAGVFKSLTGNRSNKSPLSTSSSNVFIPASTVQIAQQLNSPNNPAAAIYDGPSDYEKLYEQLKPDRPLSVRVAAADSLRLAIADYPLNGVTSIWYAAKDLIDPKNPIETRRAGFGLLTACVKNGSSTDLERKEYFNTLTATLDPDDFHLQLAAVIELAKDGKDLSGFHYDAIPLLTHWLGSAFEAFDSARPKQSSGKSVQGKGPAGEETNIHTLFEFIINVIKFSFNVAGDDETGKLIDQVIYVANHARAAAEIRGCVKVLDAIVTYGDIPRNRIKEYATVLCSIHFLVAKVREEAWLTISNLCKSHNGAKTVRILLDVLRYQDRQKNLQANLRAVRGSLSVLERIVAENGTDGFPTVGFQDLMDALVDVSANDHPKLDFDILHLILSLFNEDPDHPSHNIIEEDWTKMLDVAAKCSLRAAETSDGRHVETRSQSMSPTPSMSGSEVTVSIATSMGQMLYRLITKLEQLLVAGPYNDFPQRDTCIKFFTQVHAHLPESCATLVIDYFAEFRLCYPTDENWKSNIQVLLDAFFSNHSRPTQIRLQALKAVTDVYEAVEIIGSHNEDESGYSFTSEIFKTLAEEDDIAVLQEVTSLMVAVATNADSESFEKIVKQLHHSLSIDRLNAPLFAPGSRNVPSPLGSDVHTTSVTPSNVITRGLISIFMQTFHISNFKALRVFDEILSVCKSSSCDTDARLSAMKMLFRLRADWANRIFLTRYTEAESLASVLYRTPESLARKHAFDDAQASRTARGDDGRAPRVTSGGHSYTNVAVGRTASGMSRPLQRNHQMWMTPDPDALPEQSSEDSSIFLVSIVDDSEGGIVTISSNRKVLKIDAWLDTAVDLLEKGCDWEIYSYILAHLPSQLTNKALFRGAIPQVKRLRKVLCEQIKTSSFMDPPLASGLRKGDVSVCHFQILTTVMSYHQEFLRTEEDDIVKSFIHGLNTWESAAKCCIHALSICCHELPASMKLVLINILLKMSQIITQSNVAEHILEFLACLARMPHLYAHFREDEYRTVFGIAFRYLQSVRDQNARSAVNRNSNPVTRQSNSPASNAPGDTTTTSTDGTTTEVNTSGNSDDLPQYVYALAYHIVVFWFLCLKLSDRAAHASWIIKNLVWTDNSGRQHVDEQAEVTLDFMRRTAYADVDESKADPAFTTDNYGEIQKSRWLVGQSIITVEQATHSGWAQVTKRQPSATSHYMIRQKFEAPPAHQIANSPDNSRIPQNLDSNVLLASNIPVQLIAPFVTMSENTRPIRLPNDDMVRRAIQSFDRVSTVDGHKVGVIYIGENQTNEVEILSNVIGSSDYQEFLEGLGTLTKLEGATFNTQGLDRQYNTDGEFTYCWRDRVSEIVFHVTTLMPTNIEHDPQCANKKKHIGNDFVNIIFNASGRPFRFDTFPSDFNFVNIVITPESRASFVATRLRSKSYTSSGFYKVQVMSKAGFPEISPAAETKVLGLEALPDFIRLVALNASVFSLVWANRKGGEHISSWRTRLREIGRLRTKYKPASNSTTSPPGTALSNGSGSQDLGKNVRDSFSSLRRSSVATFSTNLADHDKAPKHTFDQEGDLRNGGEEEGMLEGIDFSKWA